MDAYVRALTAPRPLLRRRYKVGRDSIYLFAPFSLWPAFFQDKLFILISYYQRMPKPDSLR